MITGAQDELLPDEKAILAQIKELELHAKNLLELKNRSIGRWPIVIEFCGSPKAGKSSCLSSLDIFLRRNNFKTKVLTERASVCPIENKFDPLFNIWTGCSMLAQLSEMIANHSKEYDVIIADRGIFDALCWFEWQRNGGYVGLEDLDRFVKFFTAHRWRMIVDLVYVFRADPKVSMQREYATLLTRKQGRVMRQRILSGYLDATYAAESAYGKLFRKIESIDTSNLYQNDVSYKVTQKTLTTLHDVLTEKIGFFRRSDLPKLRPGVYPYEDIFDSTSVALQFDNRDVVERDIDRVQPVPVAVLKDSNSNRFLIAKKHKKQTQASSPEKGKILLYFGGHVREEDKTVFENPDMKSIFLQSLFREIKEEIGIDINVPFDSPFCVWGSSPPRSQQHIAIVFVIERDFEHLPLNFDKREFSFQGDLKTGQLVTLEKIAGQFGSIDEWSRQILKRKFYEDIQEIAESTGQLKFRELL